MRLALRHFLPPQPSLRFVPIWRRNFLVWRKLTIPSILGNLADPLLYLPTPTTGNGVVTFLTG